MNNFLIETNKIKKNFNHRNGLVRVFENVNIKVKPGELIALVLFCIFLLYWTNQQADILNLPVLTQKVFQMRKKMKLEKEKYQ